MAKIGILVDPAKLKERANAKCYFDNFAYMGLHAVIDEATKGGHEIEYIAPHKIDECDFVFVSLISAWDILSLIRRVPKKRKAKVVIGGQGLVNPCSYLEHFDIGVFGRAEGQINDILDGARPSNVLDTKMDPQADGHYEYRQAQWLVGEEKNVGCLRKCYFCGYSWTHKRFRPDKNYQSAGDSIYSGIEDTLLELELKSNTTHITGLDGYSEKSRMAAGKRISNKQVEDKLVSLIDQSAELGWNRLSLKLYMIHAYPWETLNDTYTAELRSVFAAVDKRLKRGKGLIFLKTTPFCPEPMTPMAWLKPDFRDEWRRMLHDNYLVYEGEHVIVRIHEAIDSAAELALMVFFRRAGVEMSPVAEMMARPEFFRLRARERLAALRLRGVLSRLEEGTVWDGVSVPGIYPEKIAKKKPWDN